MNISDEERKRRSEAAKELHRQGKIGGDRRSEGAGRPKVEKATAKIAKAADRSAEKMVRELNNILKNGKPGEKLKAIELWLSIANKEQDKAEKKELQQIQSAGRDELLKIVGAQIIPLLEAGLSVPGLEEEDFIDAEGEEITDE